MIIRRKRFECWITKGTNAHSEYVLLLVLPRQKWLLETASVLRYMYVCTLAMLLKIDSTSQDHTGLLYALLTVFQYHPCEHIQRRSIHYRH